MMLDTVKIPITIVALLVVSLAHADDWPQWRGAASDGVWREAGIVQQFKTGDLPVRWKAPVGPGFSGPAVGGGKVFITDRVLGESGNSDVKTRWDFRDKTAGEERVFCLDESTGKLLWKFTYPVIYSVAYGQGPRATPAVAQDKVYTLGAMGDLYCFEVASGKVVWKKNLVQEYTTPVPLYGFSAAPLLDGERVIVMVGGKDQAVVAFDRQTGKELWACGTASNPGYCSPLIATLAGTRQLVVWHGEGLAGIEVETGKILWSVPHKTKEALAIATPAIEGDRLAISSQYEGAMMLQFKPGAAEPQILWKASTGAIPEREWKKSGLNTTLSPVLLIKNHVYGVSLYGETCCLNGDTGERMWTTLEPSSGGTTPRERWSTFFAVRHDDKVFIFNEKGDLILADFSPAGYREICRAHLIDPDMASSGNGRKVIWSHPAFANRCIYVRNNQQILCISLQSQK